ncbi:MAG TPA: hypothetical protein VLF60_01515 [Candidatus Saccharimonadales bacterium]|nr:hypothetical protein [Candidatus Saccharimonadales bacterium]
MIFWIVCAVILLFAFVIFFGAPYLPTKRHQVAVALELLQVRAGATIVDLGSGDGILLKAAARQGAVVYGYELNPILCAVSWLRCLRYRQQVHIRCANFWHVELPADTTGVYIFLLHRYMKRLDDKMTTEAKRLGHTVQLASFTFAIPGKQAAAVRDGVFLYTYSGKH